VKLTTHLHLVPRSGMCGAIPPPQHDFMAWCSVKHRDFTFYNENNNSNITIIPINMAVIISVKGQQ
jgi:hypothetical protein